MNKRNISIGVIILVAVIGFFAIRSGDTSTADLFVKPSVGEFVVDVVTTGELRAKILKKLWGLRVFVNFG